MVGAHWQLTGHQCRLWRLPTEDSMASAIIGRKRDLWHPHAFSVVLLRANRQRDRAAEQLVLPTTEEEVSG
jgi:hypothetical protein